MWREFGKQGSLCVGVWEIRKSMCKGYGKQESLMPLGTMLRASNAYFMNAVGKRQQCMAVHMKAQLCLLVMIPRRVNE